MKMNCNLIILNWNSCELLKRCLHLVGKNTEPVYKPFIKLIIVDNGSKDHSYDFLRTLPYKVIYNEKNLGFAGGVNSGLRKVTDPEADICLLNVDAEVQPGWLPALYETMAQKSNIGLVGPLGNNVPSNFQREGSVQCDTIVPNLHFFCVLIRREVVNKIGFFDTQYGLGNYDDNDYGTRARLAGYTHCISVKSLVRHEPHQVFNINNIDHNQLEMINREKFLNKFFGIMLRYSEKYDFFADPLLAKFQGLIIPEK